MKDVASAFRRRMTALLVGLCLAVIAIGGLAYVVERRAQNAVNGLARIELQAVQLARQFSGMVDDMHGALLRLGYDPADDSVATIADRKQQMVHWLKARLAAARSDEERNILRQLDAELRAYFIKIDTVLERPGGTTGRLDRNLIVIFDDTSIRLQSFAADFAAGHDAAQRELLTRSLNSVRSQRQLVLGCLTLLVIAVSAVGVLVFRDVVEPLRMQLVESAELLAKREKLVALGTLAAGVAHEIRNPLTAIKARLYTLRRAITAPAATQDVNAIAAEIDRLECIVRDVLGYARPMEPVFSEVELTAWLRELASFMQSDLKAVSVELNVVPSEPVTILADPAHLRQILLNLIRNAQEAFASRPGRIALSVKRERSRLHGTLQPIVIVSVADNGPGIPPDVQPRLFDPFFTTKAAGTGLGLSIVAQLVEAHGGEIAFQTAPGIGTTFSLRLPEARTSSDDALA